MIEPFLGEHPICVRFNRDADRKRYSWTNIFGAHRDAIKGDLIITLGTQFTSDRFDRLSWVAKHWPGESSGHFGAGLEPWISLTGPISASVYLSVKELKPFVDNFCTDENTLNRNNIQIHVSYNHGVSMK